MTRHKGASIYTSSIKMSGLRVRECRLIADLLLAGIDHPSWMTAIVRDNLLQIPSPHTAQRIGSLLRARIEPLGANAWSMIRDGDAVLATQTCFAGTVRNSRLLGDFLDLVVRDQFATFATTLELHLWPTYIDACRGRDPEMPDWSTTTIKRLRSGVFAVLAEGGYIDTTRSRRLQNVFVDDALQDLLQSRNERYVLRCMRVGGVAADA